MLDALAATGCPPIETVIMHAGPVSLRGRPEAVDGTAVMYCPRRTVLDMLLVDAARAAGAEVREATLVREVIRAGDRIVGVRAIAATGETIEAKSSLVIGADGLNSSVAAMVGCRHGPVSSVADLRLLCLLERGAGRWRRVLPARRPRYPGLPDA
ncbi:MAG: FAD-dependent monooxygenase [Enhydrobacter sp.]|nr:FAD-dependent monooxygenase [Enhydrobacter sp.]